MRRITFYLIAFFLVASSWQGMAQTLNQNAGWPNAGWTVTGTYNSDPSSFEADPTVVSNFAYDDDDGGSDVSNIEAESPVIDLTAASTAGEIWISVSGDYVYNYVSSPESLEIQYWDADTSSWATWYAFPLLDTASVPNNDFCGGTSESYTTPNLDIVAFTATQLSGFKYRIAYNDGGGWKYGFCFQSPTIVSATPPEYSPIATLADLRAGTIGEKYEFTGEGFATAARLSASGDGSMRVFGQDATAGMQFYAAAGVISSPSINFGDGVTAVRGILTEAYGTLVFVVAEDITMTGNNQPIVPEEVTAQNYVDNREDYESELIKILNATIDPNGDTDFVLNSQYALTDDTGGNVTLGVVFPQLDGAIPTLANVTGIAVEYNTTPVLLPRADVDVEALTCAPPADLTVSDESDVSAVLGWTAGLSSDTMWDVEWGAVGFAPGTGVELGSVTDTTDNPYTATSLTPETDYEFYVRTTCTDGEGEWVGPVAFTTLVTPPANDNCGMATVISCDDSLTGETTVAASDNGDDLSTHYGMGKGVWYKFIGNDNTVTIAVTTVSFDIEVGVASSADCVTFDNANSVDSEGASATETLEFDADAGTEYFIYVASYGNTSSTTGDFDIAVTCVPYPSCPDVANLAVANLSAPSNADLTWDVTTDATGYNWEIQPQGTAQGDAALVEGGNVTTNAASATALVGGTDYTLYVQSDCGGGTTGNYISYDFSFILPPVNDTCATATIIVCDDDLTNQTTVGASDNGDDVGCDQGKGVWYKFEGNDSDVTLVSTTDFDHAIGIATSTDCATFTDVVCKDSSTGTETVTFAANLGTDYFIYIGYYEDSTITGTFGLAVTCVPFPTCTNATATFTVVDDCANGEQFFIDVDVTDMGTASALTISDNQGSASQALTAASTVQFGPYANTTDIIITITDDNDASCVFDSGSLTLLSCNTILMSDGTATTCEAAFYDTGGATEDFQDNEDYTLVVTPGTSGEMLIVTFTEFDMDEGDFDYLVAYDGSDASAPVLFDSRTVSDADMLATFTATNATGEITFVFHSSTVVPNPGWIATLSCTTSANIADNVIDGFTLYPNPAEDVLNINASNKVESVTIYNLLGQEVINTSDTQIDIRNLTSGAYVIKVQVGNQIGAYNFIKK